jgi:hypothetical protein
MVFHGYSCCSRCSRHSRTPILKDRSFHVLIKTLVDERPNTNTFGEKREERREKREERREKGLQYCSLALLVYLCGVLLIGSTLQHTAHYFFCTLRSSLLRVHDQKDRQKRFSPTLLRNGKTSNIITNLPYCSRKQICHKSSKFIYYFAKCPSIRNVPFSTPKQVKPSGLIPKHKQPFFLTLFPNLTFFQTMKTQNVIQILELNQPTSTLPAQPRTRYAKPTPPSNPSMGPP